MKWVESGSVVMQTEEYRLRTERSGNVAGIELVLARTLKGAWKLSCAQLWGSGQSKVIAPSDTAKEDAQQAALVTAHNRLSELGSALPRMR